MKIKGKIRVWQWLFALSGTALAVGLCFGDATLDVNVHDTYFVFSAFDLSLLLALFYALNALFYWLIGGRMRRPLVHWLTWLHAGGLMADYLIGFATYAMQFRAALRHDPFTDLSVWNAVLTITFVLTVLVLQPLGFVNWLVSAFRAVKMTAN